MWNGITATPDGKTVFVLDILERGIFAFQHTANGDLIEYVPLILN